MVILFILFIVFLVVGRVITMWYVGTDQIVKGQKEIIALLTEIADNTKPIEDAPMQVSRPGVRPVASNPLMRSS
jgi:hypothetical protein